MQDILVQLCRKRFTYGLQINKTFLLYYFLILKFVDQPCFFWNLEIGHYLYFGVG